MVTLLKVNVSRRLDEIVEKIDIFTEDAEMLTVNMTQIGKTKTFLGVLLIIKL